MSVNIMCSGLGYVALNANIKGQKLTTTGITLTDAEWVTLTPSEKIVLDTLKAKGHVTFTKGGVDIPTAGEMLADTDVASSTILAVATAGNWTVEPTNVKAALDELASRVKTLEAV